MRLVVVGSIGLDDVETPFGSVTRALGGSSIFFSIASSFFVDVGLVGIVGEDFPEAGIDALTSKGVDVTGLERVPGKTFRWAGKYGYDLNDRKSLRTDLNVFESFKPTLPEAYRDAEFVFLGNIHPELQLDVLDQATQARFVALDTMDYWIEGSSDALMRVLSRVNAIMINDSEARQLTGEPNIVRAARAITEMGPELVVIKRGEYGALIYRDGAFFFVPAFPIEDVRDPTGAGDSFAGGFMGYVAKHRNLEWTTLCQATIVGSTLASFCVEDFSIQRLNTLTDAQITARANRFRELTHTPRIVIDG